MCLSKLEVPNLFVWNISSQQSDSEAQPRSAVLPREEINVKINSKRKLLLFATKPRFVFVFKEVRSTRRGLRGKKLERTLLKKTFMIFFKFRLTTLSLNSLFQLI